MPSQALAQGVLQDGDTVLIKGGDYVDCVHMYANNITIRGQTVNGQRPHLRDKTCNQMGILVIHGANYLIDNIELSGAVDNLGDGDDNWAGIRLYDATNVINTIVRNVYFHDSDEGILGNYNTNSIVVVENSRFERLGRDGYAHGMYIGSVQQFVLRNSIVSSNHADGHLVKTRALQSVIECNTLAGLDGYNSFALDMPQGGDETIRYNVMENGPNVNNTSRIVSYKEESPTNPVLSLSFHDNYVINDANASSFFNINASPTMSGWANNIFVGSGSPFSGANSGPAGSFVQDLTRAAAGLSAYDGTLATLPATSYCP